MSENKQFELLDTHKAGVRFRNSKLTDLNEDYSELRKQYHEHQTGIVTEVIGIACKFPEL